MPQTAQSVSLSYRFNRMLQLSTDRRLRRFRTWVAAKASLPSRCGSYQDSDPIRLAAIVADLPEKVDVVVPSRGPVAAE